MNMADKSPVFPGYLSWWGISSQQAYQTVTGDEFKKAIKQVKGVFLPDGRIYEADYLKCPPESKYGDRTFVVEFPNLIGSYISSRVDSVSKAVYLKKAGTLCYINEICYVVMVVMEEDLQNSDIGTLQGMNREPKFGHNNCIDENGKIINNPQIYFNVSHPFCNTFKSHPFYYINRVHHCWESLAFAFYFPNQSQFLQCPKALVMETLVEHPRCIPKPPHRWSCPDLV